MYTHNNNLNYNKYKLIICSIRYLNIKRLNRESIFNTNIDITMFLSYIIFSYVLRNELLK